MIFEKGNTKILDENRLARPIEKLNKEIEGSKKRILSLKDNWDNEGSKGYKEETWNRAIDFLKKFFRIHLRNYYNLVLTPDILPGPNGSIDIHFKTEKIELLLNIPDEQKEPISFYGDNYDVVRIEGTSDLTHVHFFIIPLLKEITTLKLK